MAKKNGRPNRGAISREVDPQRRALLKSCVWSLFGGAIGGDRSLARWPGCPSPRNRRSVSAELTFEEYRRLDGIGLAELVRKREVQPESLLEVAIERLLEVEPRINAIAGRLFDQARQAIRDGLPEGPFRGVPFLLKDLSFPMKGTVSTYGSRLFADQISDYDSTAVARYRRSGLVVFGRTRVPELGLLPTTESTFGGVTRNPWDRSRTAGGSSGGSAAAVAAGIVPMASASDGGGSIRIPAACCGLFGLKPTRARVPLGPGRFEAWGGLATLHALTRTVRDSAALLDLASGPAAGDSYCAPAFDGSFREQVELPPGRLKIAQVATMPPTDDIDEDCEAALRDAAALCESLGHEVEDCTQAFGKQFEFERLREAHGIVVLVSVRQTVSARLKALGRELRADDLEPVTRYYYDLAAQYSALQLADARAAFFQAARTMARFLGDYDLIVTPTLNQPPIEHGRITLTGMARDVIEGLLQFVPCTPLANWTGQPAMSVPLGQSKAGLPIGIQFLGRFGDEATLLRLAGQLEQARPWRDRWPQIESS